MNNLDRSNEHAFAPEHGGPLVLIVDDDKDSRDAARMVLQEEGYSVDVASNGQAALDRLKRLPAPTLLLVDLMMPVMDGPSLLSELESSAELSQIPVVVMTASGPDPRSSGLRYPVLRKPFDIDELLSLVTECSPRLWDDEEPTEETPLLSDRSFAAAVARDDATPRVACGACARVASTRCIGCGEPFCRTCIDAGPDGRCVTCWRKAHP